jgi:outer membrane protein OmpA-like peptidoglycan-associated protein
MSRAQASTLHLQMGQEVIYLLLVTSLICNLLLVAVALRSSAHVSELRSQLPADGQTAATIKRLETEKAGLLLRIKQLETTLQRVEIHRAQLTSRVKELEGELVAQKSRLQDQPPIIMLRETDGYSFDAGSADIKPEFLARLATEIVPKLTALGAKYGARIVEVIGHTDGMSIGNRLRGKANLDEFLGQYLDASSTVTVFPYDNVGLGISRAVSVARALRQSGLSARFDIQPLSAAYLISPGDRTTAAPRMILPGDVSRFASGGSVPAEVNKEFVVELLTSIHFVTQSSQLGGVSTRVSIGVQCSYFLCPGLTYLPF